MVEGVRSTSHHARPPSGGRGDTAKGLPGRRGGRALYKAMVDVDYRLADIEFWKMPYADTAAL